MNKKQITLDALKNIARMDEELKQPCGDPESAQAIRNGRYMNIAYAAHAQIQALEADLAEVVEPLAWMRNDGMKAMPHDEKVGWIKCGHAEVVNNYTTPLFAAPQEAAAPAPVNAELLAALQRLEVSANTVAYCYDKVPQNFASALTRLQEDAENASDVIKKAEGAA